MLSPSSEKSSGSLGRYVKMEYSAENIKLLPFPIRKKLGDGNFSQEWHITTFEKVSKSICNHISNEIFNEVIKDMIEVLVEQGCKEKIPDNYASLFSLSILQGSDNNLIFSCKTTSILNGDIVFPMRAIQKFSNKYMKVKSIQGEPLSKWEECLFYKSL